MTKLEAFHWLFGTSPASDTSVLIVVDATHPGVTVPPEYKVPALGLRLGFMMSPPMYLRTDTGGIKAIISFQGRGHDCAIPWDAVYSMQLDGESFVISWLRMEPVAKDPEPEPPKARHLRSV
jgi:stringent starvation protein B